MRKISNEGRYEATVIFAEVRQSENTGKFFVSLGFLHDLRHGGFLIPLLQKELYAYRQYPALCRKACVCQCHEATPPFTAASLPPLC